MPRIRLMSSAARCASATTSPMSFLSLTTSGAGRSSHFKQACPLAEMATSG